MCFDLFSFVEHICVGVFLFWKKKNRIHPSFSDIENLRFPTISLLKLLQLLDPIWVSRIHY